MSIATDIKDLFKVKSSVNGVEKIDNKITRKKSGTQLHELKQTYESRQDLLTLKNAVEISNNIQTYERFDLHKIYAQALRDPEFAAQWRTRVLKTLDKEFHIETVDGEENRVAREMFMAPWFHDWIELVLEQVLWGFSLVEFGPWDGEKNCFVPYLDSTGLFHEAVENVNRDYVKPEFGMIVPHYGDGQDKGTSYLTGFWAKKLMFVGGSKKTDSILYNSASYMLMKDNAMKNWSEWIEVFAMDMRIGKTEAQGADRKDFVKAMRDMGGNGYAVIDVDDEVDYVGMNRQDAYRVYEAFLKYCDGEIAKLIFGQDVVTNNTGRVVGKVGEDVSNMYGDTDAKYIEWVINTRLIPYMGTVGAEVDGIRFKYDTTEKVRLSDRAKIDGEIAKMGFRIADSYIERTYGTDITEYIGIPFSGREGEETKSEDDK